MTTRHPHNTGADGIQTQTLHNFDLVRYSARKAKAKSENTKTHS